MMFRKKRKEKNLAKKKQASLILQEELDKTNRPWSDIGDYLKSYQTLEVPAEWSEYINRQLNLAQNIQNCFEQAKSQAKKRLSLEEKLRHLRNEIENLLNPNSVPNISPREKDSKPSMGSLFLQKAEAKGRKLVLNTNVEAVVGKSGKDNLALLRKAQAWDLWVHLKDFPGAHAIIRRPRNANINYQDILKVGEWVLRESKLTNSVESGEKFDIGRVSYQNEKTYTISI
jgi:predicted ribosome quality control (RQC) complex YloA/Tae2 family protein